MKHAKEPVDGYAVSFDSSVAVRTHIADIKVRQTNESTGDVSAVNVRWSAYLSVWLK